MPSAITITSSPVMSDGISRLRRTDVQPLPSEAFAELGEYDGPKSRPQKRRKLDRARLDAGADYDALDSSPIRPGRHMRARHWSKQPKTQLSDGFHATPSSHSAGPSSIRQQRSSSAESLAVDVSLVDDPPSPPAVKALHSDFDYPDIDLLLARHPEQDTTKSAATIAEPGPQHQASQSRPQQDTAQPHPTPPQPQPAKQHHPPTNKHSTTTQAPHDIDTIPSKRPRKRKASTEDYTKPSTMALSDSDDQPPKHKPPTAAPSSVMPPYDLWSDAKLAAEVEKNGFKLIRQRSAMIDLVKRCWASRQELVSKSGTGSNIQAQLVASTTKPKPSVAASGTVGGKRTTVATLEGVVRDLAGEVEMVDARVGELTTRLESQGETLQVAMDTQREEFRRELDKQREEFEKALREQTVLFRTAFDKLRDGVKGGFAMVKERVAKLEGERDANAK